MAASVLTLACALRSAVVAGLPENNSLSVCTKECVCDGIDLSLAVLGTTVFTAVGAATHVAENGTATTTSDGWEYRLSLCGPIEHAPLNCPDRARVLQLPRPDSGRSGCTGVGTELVTARHRHNSLELVWQSEAEPNPHELLTVQGRLICDRSAGIGQPGDMLAVEGGGQYNCKSR